VTVSYHLGKCPPLILIDDWGIPSVVVNLVGRWLTETHPHVMPHVQTLLSHFVLAYIVGHTEQGKPMGDKDETVAIRLWRDRVQIREQERDDALARLNIAEEKVSILTGEISRLAAENIRLRAQRDPDAGQIRSETERQMEELRGALIPLLADTPLRH
jgi:hypothetical protein